MTDIGYENIKKRIKEHWIIPPSGLNIEEFRQWLFGYQEAMDDIVEIIDSLQKGVKD